MDVLDADVGVREQVGLVVGCLENLRGERAGVEQAARSAGGTAAHDLTMVDDVRGIRKPIRIGARSRRASARSSYPRGAGRWLVAVRVLVARGNRGRSDLAATRREVPRSAVDLGNR